MNHRPSILRPLALTFLMGLPFGLGIGFLTVGTYEGWRDVKREFFEVDTRTNYLRRSLAFLEDGTPIVHSNQSVGVREWRNEHLRLDGSQLTAEGQQNVINAVQIRVRRHQRRDPFDRAPFEDILKNRNRWYVFQDPSNNSIHWSWEPLPTAPNHRVLVSRYRGSGVPVSYVTPEGFSSQLPSSSEGFEEPGSVQSDGQVVTFQSAGKLIAINISKQTVRTIAEIGVEDHGWAIVRQSDDAEYRCAVQTVDSIALYSDQGDHLFTVADLSEGALTPALYPLIDGSFVVTQVERNESERLPGGGTKYLHHVVASWIDKSGVETQTLKFTNEHMNERILSDSLFVNSVDWLMENVGQGLVAPEPAFLCGVVFILGPWANSEMLSGRSYQEAVAEILKEIPYAIPVSALIALCCAVACWRRQQKYEADWTKTWVVFIFLFGLPAWIAWRVHRRWPPLEVAGLSESEFTGAALIGLEIR